MSSALGVPLNDDLPRLKVLYVGAPKRAKTTDIATMANLCSDNQRVAYVDFENGLKARPLKARGIDVSKIIRYMPRTPEEMEEIYWLLAESMHSDPEQWIGTAVDTVTAMQSLFVGIATRTRVEKEKKKTSQEAEKLLFKPGWDEYAIWTEQAKDLLTKFRDLPCHVAFSTHEVSEATAQGLKLLPKITSSFRIDLMGYPDVIIQKVAAENPLTPDPEGIEYLGVCRNVDKYVGGDRLGITPVVLANPTMERLWGLYAGTLDLDIDPYQLAYRKRMGEDVSVASAEPVRGSDHNEQT